VSATVPTITTSAIVSHAAPAWFITAVGFALIGAAISSTLETQDMANPGYSRKLITGFQAGK
jgi:hypothetical protein